MTKDSICRHCTVCRVLSSIILTNLLTISTLAAAPQTLLRQTNLVSNQANRAKHQDADLLNPWGAVAGNDGLFWIADNGSGKSTLYDGKGVKSSLVVTLPNPTGSEPSTPTGQVLNAVVSDFLGDTFIFATENGTILGWNGGAAANVRSNQSGTGVVYKGLALARTGAGAFLFAADFHNNKIDVFDSSYNLVPAPTPDRFVDPAEPAGFAPFNVHLVGSRLYVAYARQDPATGDDVAGTGNGFISIFRTDGTFVRRFATGSGAGGKVRQLDSPWGIAIAPKSFGSFAKNVLVGNFGSGRIAAFTTRGKFVGYLSSKGNRPIRISGLWEIFFGRNGVGSSKNLYFTAGPNDEADGLFGYLSTAGASNGQGTTKPNPTARPTAEPGPTARPTARPTATPYTY